MVCSNQPTEDGRSPQAGRATLASHQAPAGLGHAEGIPDAEEALHDIADSIGGMAAWAEGKTLSVIVSGPKEPLRIAKLRFAGFSAKPSVADLRGEPE